MDNNVDTFAKSQSTEYLAVEIDETIQDFKSWDDALADTRTKV